MLFVRAGAAVNHDDVDNYGFLRWQGAHGASVISGGHEGGFLHGVLRRFHPVLEEAGAAGGPAQPCRRRRGARDCQSAAPRVSSVGVLCPSSEVLSKLRSAAADVTGSLSGCN
jgi:hypothetical protein